MLNVPAQVAQQRAQQVQPPNDFQYCALPICRTALCVIRDLCTDLSKNTVIKKTGLDESGSARGEYSGDESLAAWWSESLLECTTVSCQVTSCLRSSQRTKQCAATCRSVSAQ